MKQVKPNDKALLDAFVAAFSVGATDIYGQWNWQPLAQETDPKHLEPLYAALPGEFPPLYETLVLSYRWPFAELASMSLLANPQGPTLGGLLAEIQQDRGLWDELTPHGYIQFGRGWGGSYDPVCFDTHHRDKDGDCRVVQIDHEAILCNFRIREVSEIAGTFRGIVAAALEQGPEQRPV